jgi:glycosyltransferase involved in cell wall biosynthesis
MAFLPPSRRLTEQIRQHLTVRRFDPSQPPVEDPRWPRISVITPSFNQAAYLERTIISIHNQEYPNLEHIVMDGGSDDGSVGIIKKYENLLAHWQSGPDGGQSDAINRGAARATGRYMMWVNSDDLLLPGALRKLAEGFRSDPDADLVYGNQVEVDGGDMVIKRIYTTDFDIRDFLYEINIIVPQQSAMWTTELFHRIGGLKMYRYAMDYDLFYRMHAAGACFHRIPGFLSAFRVHREGLTGSGQVARHRGDEVDDPFRSCLGRDRNFWDRWAMRLFYRTRRFIREPRAALAAVEHRTWVLFSKG